jgi:hypothetical protein
MDFKFYSLAVFIYAYCFPTQFPYIMMFLSFNWNPTGVTRHNMIALPEHWSITYSVLGFALLIFYCLSVISVDHCLSLWPLNCMYNRYNKYRLTTYDYPFGILNLLYYLSTHNFSFMCMFCRSFFVLLYFFFWWLYCLLRYTNSDSPFWYLKTLLWLFVIYVRITTICCFPKLYHINMYTQIINTFQISTIVTYFSFNYIHL